MLIKANNISYSYPDSEGRALSSVNLKVREGEMVAIMGENGSGKTTLLKLLAGMLEPEEGQIGRKKDSRDFLGFIPENPGAGFFADSVKEEVEFFPKNVGHNYGLKARESMRKVGILHLEDKSPFALSAGEKRLVSIASILSGDPDVMILDEPITSLDREAERELGQLLNLLKRSSSILFSTHNSDFTYEYADRIIVINNGTIARRGKPKQVLSDLKFCREKGVEVPGVVKWALSEGIEPPQSFKKAVSVYDKGGFH